jgi:hypothetical protein
VVRLGEKGYGTGVIPTDPEKAHVCCRRQLFFDLSPPQKPD